MMIKLFEKYLNNKKIYWIFYPEIPNNLNSDNTIKPIKNKNIKDNSSKSKSGNKVKNLNKRNFIC